MKHFESKHFQMRVFSWTEPRGQNEINNLVSVGEQGEGHENQTGSSLHLTYMWI